MRRLGAGLVIGALGVLASVGAAPAYRGAAQEDSVSCSWQSGFTAVPGFSLAPRGGSLTASGSGSGSCSGTLDGYDLNGSALGLRFNAGYGPQSTCGFASGNSDLEAHIVRGTAVHRVQGAFGWNAPALQAGASGSLGGGQSQLSFTLAGEQTCGLGVVASGSMSLSFTAAGNIRRMANARPSSALSANPERIKGHGPVDIDMEVSDPDGSSDLRDVTVALRDNHGRAIGSWSGSELRRQGATRLTLAVRDFKLHGPHPWRVELTGTDRAFHDFAAAVTLRRK